jgi:hypothetical protein
MTRQQKRKMERNSKKKQTCKINIFSNVMVDTKSIIENKNQFALIDEVNFKNHLKKNKKLMETIVLVNFGDESQNNIGILHIIHNYINESDSKSLINSAINEMFETCLKLNIESVLQGLIEVNVLDHLTLELEFDSTKSFKENIDDKVLDASVKLMGFNKEILEAA